VSEKEYQLNREFSTNDSHIQISLNNIMQRIFPSKDLMTNFKEEYELNLDEGKGILLLRMLNFEEITVVNEEDSEDQIIYTANLQRKKSRK